MSLRKVRRGSGITEREEIDLHNVWSDEDVEELMALRRTTSDSFEDVHGHPLEVDALQVLADAGMVYFRGGLKIGDRIAVMGRDYEEDGPIDYARRVLVCLTSIRDAMKRAHVEQIASGAFLLGMIAKEAEIKFRWERDALRGKASVEAGRRGGKMKGNRNRQRNIDMAREFRKQRQAGSRRSDSDLKEKIGEAYGIRRSAAIAAINEGLKFLSG